MRRRWPPWLVVGLLVVVGSGAWLRFFQLGAADIGGSEIGLLVRLLQKPTAEQILTDHRLQFASFRALPMPRLAAVATNGANGPVDAQGRPDPALLRLAFALAGVAGVLAMVWLGAELGGASQAVLLGLLAAFQPFHLFWSRTAFVPVFVALFAALLYAATIRLTARLLRRGGADLASWGLLTAVAVAASWCDLALWPAVLLAWGLPILAWRLSGDRSRGDQLKVLIGPALWLLSLTPWLGAWAAGGLQGGGLGGNFWDGVLAMWRLPLAATFGGGWRAALSLGLLAAAFLSRETRGRALVLTLYGASLFVPLCLLQASGAPTLREMTPLWPILLALAGLGALAACRELESAVDLPRSALVSAGALLLAAALASPVLAVLELRGRPAEYTRLAAALDELVAEGVPALVNGRSVVEYEMRPHPPERAVVTFTVPDAGFEQWRDNRWRESAEDFLRRFEDAPLVQQGRRFYDREDVGPWAFPEAHFARRIELRNEPAELLAELHLAAIEDFYGPRTVTEISYNLPEDLIAAARREGRESIALWGEGWGYQKTADLEDWRVLGRRAVLEVHHLAAQPRSAVIELTVGASSARKRLSINGVRLEVPPAEESQRLRLRQELEPGRQEIVLEDDLFEYGGVP
ncbi:MAG: hypothetical protein AAF725_20550, partial [Acidobacteriota bacterium]